MPRISRLLNPDHPTIYHVMSRTALEGFPLEAVEKDYLLSRIQVYSCLYFTDIFGFALMGNHFHILLKMTPGAQFSDEQIRARVEAFRNDGTLIKDEEIPFYREKLGNLSEFMKDVKQSFTRYFNKRRNRSGFFWGQRFKSVILQEGLPLLNCMAYIDLNPVRANLCEHPEDYRWNTTGYLAQRNNEDGFLKGEFGLNSEESLSFEERFAEYRRFVYEVGVLPTPKGKSISKTAANQASQKGYKVTRMDRFRHRTRYFTDSGVIGSKEFVASLYQRFKGCFQSKYPKKPVAIEGIEECFSLKRLAFSGT